MDAAGRKHNAFVQMTPLLFRRYADEFREAASDMGSDFTPVQCFLYCKSIELSLKAFLLAKGTPVAMLKGRKKTGIGHDLEAALREAESRGLGDFVQIGPESREELRKANDFYEVKGFEYADNEEVMLDLGYFPDPKVLSRFARVLIWAFEDFWVGSKEGLAEKSRESKLEI
jgi:HEPN domain-containing protein